MKAKGAAIFSLNNRVMHLHTVYVQQNSLINYRLLNNIIFWYLSTIFPAPFLN